MAGPRANLKERRPWKRHLIPARARWLKAADRDKSLRKAEVLKSLSVELFVIISRYVLEH
jgi:hypothetical protein